MHRVVFAIHGKKFAPGFFCRGHHQLTRSDQNLLVRKRHRLSQLHCFVSRFQPHDAHRRRYNDVRLGVRPDHEHSFALVVNLRNW